MGHVTLSFSQGEAAEEMGAKYRQHVMEMMQSGDEDHKAAVESMMQLSKEEQEKGYDKFRSKFDSLQGA